MRRTSFDFGFSTAIDLMMKRVSNIISDGEPSTSPVRPSSANIGKLNYPMWVMPIRELLSLKKLREHEELVIEGKVVEWRKGMGGVIFVSHSWLGFNTPDPQCIKLPLLQKLLRKAATRSQPAFHAPVLAVTQAEKREFGAAREALQRAEYVWIDVASIPQVPGPDQVAGIHSLPAYVQLCECFLVLAPPAVHESGDLRDLRGWYRRGWCRVELLSNALCGDKALLVVQSASDISMQPSGGMIGRDWLRNPVGLADFAVDSDRELLGPVVHRLVEERKAHALRTGDKTMFRVLHANTTRLCMGTGFEVPVEAELNRWMATMGFDDEREGEGDTDARVKPTGLSPLMFAVWAGRVDLVRELIERGANVNVRLAASDWRFSTIQGWSPLIVAARFHDDAELIRLLLAHRADPTIEEHGVKSTAIHIACAEGNMAAFDALFEHDASLAAHPSVFGWSPLVAALMFGQAAALEHASKRLPQQASALISGAGDVFGSSALCLTLGLPSLIGDLPTMQAVLRAGADVNQPPGRVSAPPFRKMLRVIDFVGRWRGYSQGLGFVLAYGTRCTALHAAAFAGNLGAIALFLEHGAHVNSQLHPLRYTPLHLAALAGYDGAAERLLRAGGSLTLRDRRGRTAAQVARSRGHRELAAKLAGGGHRSILVDRAMISRVLERFRLRCSSALPTAPRRWSSTSPRRKTSLTKSGTSTRRTTCTGTSSSSRSSVTLTENTVDLESVKASIEADMFGSDLRIDAQVSEDAL